MTTSHIGQNIKDHVVLTGKGSQGDIALNTFERVFPDGSVTAFEIPSDRFLVITDVEWQVFRKMLRGSLWDGLKSDFESGDVVWLEIVGISGYVLFSSRTTVVVVDGLAVGTSEQLTTGFTLGAGRILARAQVVSPQQKGATFVGDLVAGFLILRGYLIDAEETSRQKSGAKKRT